MRPARNKPVNFRCLFLLLSLGLSGLTSTLLTSTSVALVRTSDTQLAESTALDGSGHVRLANLLDGLVNGDDGEGSGGLGDGVLSNGLDVLLGGVTLLGLVALLGEEDQAAGVGLEALDVGGEGLLRDVLAAGIDGDTDGGGILAGNTSGLQNVSVLNLYT